MMGSGTTDLDAAELLAYDNGYADGWAKGFHEKSQQIAAQQATPPSDVVGLEWGPRCPFCQCDPFHYENNGIGLEAVAVTCCDLGNYYFRGARPAPEEVTLSWDEFVGIADKLAAAYTPKPDAVTDEVRELRGTAQFLLDRLSEVEITDEMARDWMGHVEPAIERLRSTLISIKGAGE